jgi:hypothetical protein
MSPIEFRPDGTPVDIGPDYREVASARRNGRRLLSNGIHAVEILSPGKKRDRFLARYEAEHPQKPEPTVVFDSPLRITQESTQPVTASATTTRAVVDEQIEVDEAFVPDPRDWFDCVLSLKLQDSIVGELSNGESVWICERDITVKNGGHSLCLPKDTRLAVRLEPNRRENSFRYSALECQVLDTEQPKETHATGTVLHWGGTLGGARMPCGCSIGIGTATRDEVLDLNPGDPVEFEIIFYPKKQKYIGINVQPVQGLRGQGVRNE